MKKHARSLSQELDWLRSVLETRLKLYFQQEAEHTSIFDIPPPDLSKDASAYAQLLNEYQLDASERLVLILTLAPHLKPELLDILLIQNPITHQVYTEFGGRTRGDQRGFLPTGETALFLLAGGDLEARFKGAEILNRKHLLFREHILQMDAFVPRGIRIKSLLRISEGYLHALTSAKAYRPAFSSQFPATPLISTLDWSDLALKPKIQQEIQEILIWLENEETLLNDWNLSQHIKPGYKCLFQGSSGSTKTLATTLIGKSSGREVYEVDTELLISRNLRRSPDIIDNFFRITERNGWILFFDEADSIFGKRTNVRESHSRYTNQEISYLQQKIEDYAGLIVFASDSKEELELPFALDKRLAFPEPDARQRLALWLSIFSSEDKKYELDKDIDFQDLAKRFELNRDEIIQVLKYAATAVIGRGENTIRKQDIIAGIRKAMIKSGKVL